MIFVQPPRPLFVRLPCAGLFLIASNQHPTRRKTFRKDIRHHSTTQIALQASRIVKVSQSSRQQNRSLDHIQEKWPGVTFGRPETATRTYVDRARRVIHPQPRPTSSRFVVRLRQAVLLRPRSGRLVVKSLLAFLQYYADQPPLSGGFVRLLLRKEQSN